MRLEEPPARLVLSGDTLAALRELPSRSPVAAPPATSQARWEMVDIDRYAVTVDAGTVGYVDVVGAVFVALRGPRYDRAVEVLQTLVFEDAISSLSGIGADGRPRSTGSARC